MKTRLPVLLLLLIVPCIALGQVQGAVVVSHDYDAAKNMVTMHILNQSGKDITAYDIAVTETYPGSKVPHTHWLGTEMVGVMLSIVDPTDIHHEDAIESHHGDNGTWQAGTTRDELVIVGRGLQTFEASLDTVIYADRTAETTNPDALKRLLDDRKNYAATLEAASKLIRNALANSNDATPHETARKQVEALGKSREGSGASGYVSLELKNAPVMAQHFGKSLPDYLNDLAAHTSHRATLMLEHATVTVVGGAK